MMKSDQKGHKTWGDELRVSMVKQRDIPVIASPPPESETQIFDTLDKERTKFTDGIKMFVQKSMKKKNQLFVDRHDNPPFEVVLKKTGETMNPQKTIQQAGIQEGDVIQLHVRQGSNEKMNHSKQILLKEYKDLIDLKEKSNGMIDFRVSNGYRKYIISVKGVETIVGTTRENFVKSDHHVFTIDLPPKYPLQSPIIRFNSSIFHPNWSSDGKVDYEMRWRSGDKKLSIIVTNIINMMRFNIIDTHSPLNQDANEWYKRNKGIMKDIISKIRLPSSHEEEKLEFYE
jgi:ubiquitin-protein ligase